MPFKKSTTKPEQKAPLLPPSELKTLSTSDIIPSQGNPRILFDPEPLRDLRENIKEHGVLVPLTVFPVKGQDKYRILDGERRYRCCVELEREGIAKPIPVNVVHPPNKVAGLLYMFSIHEFREPWELMPTARSLEIVMGDLEERDSEKLSNLTGLSFSQIERCKKLLEFPPRFQDMSLDPDPKHRIPSNFWIEALPVLNLTRDIVPDLYEKLHRDGITDQFVAKYRAKKITSVLHFRKIMEAHQFAETGEQKAAVAARLRSYIENIDLETRDAFDEFVVDNKRVKGAIDACDSFMDQLAKAKLDYVADNRSLIDSLRKVQRYVQATLEKLKGSDPPKAEEAPGDKK